MCVFLSISLSLWSPHQPTTCAVASRCTNKIKIKPKPGWIESGHLSHCLYRASNQSPPPLLLIHAWLALCVCVCVLIGINHHHPPSPPSTTTPFDLKSTTPRCSFYHIADGKPIIAFSPQPTPLRCYILLHTVQLHSQDTVKQNKNYKEEEEVTQPLRNFLWLENLNGNGVDCTRFSPYRHCSLFWLGYLKAA